MTRAGDFPAAFLNKQVFIVCVINYVVPTHGTAQIYKNRFITPRIVLIFSEIFAVCHSAGKLAVEAVAFGGEAVQQEGEQDICFREAVMEKDD